MNIPSATYSFDLPRAALKNKKDAGDRNCLPQAAVFSYKCGEVCD
jgi:hypothetical protein